MSRQWIYPTLVSLLLSTNLRACAASTNGTSTPIPPRSSLTTLASQQPDADGWVVLDSYGIMMHLAERDDNTSDCTEVGCMQHMDVAGDLLQPPERNSAIRTYQRSSRDLVKRSALIGVNSVNGELVHSLPLELDEDEVFADDNERSDADGGQSGRTTLLDLFKRESKKQCRSKNCRAKSSKKSKGKSEKNKSKSKSGGNVKAKAFASQAKAVDADTIQKVTDGIADVMKGATIATTITWYTGHDLLNPFCDKQSRWTPTDDSLIIAVTEKWSLRPACGEFLELTTVDAKDGEENRSVVARVVDLCGGCAAGKPHADLSKAAFLKLYALDVGLVRGLKMRLVAPPKVWSTRLYGPKNL
ncbi:hypothetical protein EMMF5_004625 [Cystobasidiomycetes sp. EMM_F5]